MNQIIRDKKGQFVKGSKKGFQIGNKIWLGKKLSKETKRKISLKAMGNKRALGIKRSKETKEKIRLARLEKPRPELVGKNNPNWRGGTTSSALKIRHSLEYKIWRRAVFERDNYTCIWCGQRGGKLCADHIKPFSLFPELRFAIDNGRTLCWECHQKTDTFLYKARKKYV